MLEKEKEVVSPGIHVCLEIWSDHFWLQSIPFLGYWVQEISVQLELCLNQNLLLHPKSQYSLGK